MNRTDVFSISCACQRQRPGIKRASRAVHEQAQKFLQERNRSVRYSDLIFDSKLTKHITFTWFKTKFYCFLLQSDLFL